MATREPGVFRRGKDGKVEQKQAPTQPQKYGAHKQHPSKVKPAAKVGKPTSGGSITAAEKSTGKELKGDADA